MRRLSALVLAAAVSIVARPAAAGCGGGDDDDGGSSDSCPMDWGSDDGGSSGPSRPAAPRCIEVSDTLGQSQCRRFGQGWDRGGLPSFRLTVGPSVRRLRVGHLAFGGTATHFDEQYRVRTLGDHLDDSDLLVGGAFARLDAGFLDYLSAGVEASLVGARVGGPTRYEGGLAITPNEILVPGLGVVFGAALPLDVITLRAEVYAGLRVVAITSDTVRGTCEDETTESVLEGVVEPRISAEAFVSPHVSLVASVGSNLLVPGELNVGLALSLHGRSYDAQPR